MTERTWRKSSRSGSVHNCVEVAMSPAATAVRDSKDPDGGMLHVSSAMWRSFLDAVRSGRFRG
ncbi:DUF397 domain-containing protein [Saccharopolyspora rosea]|uniref:DUF397 domain-containing protein n=1 Tax=Saccharopolyspora rosea TaxID=524884 RepID=A0ABW3G0N8_9PSEU|nr:DUF397 domain-containing protein [Saccharopolyspora rosea]